MVRSRNVALLSLIPAVLSGCGALGLSTKPVIGPSPAPAAAPGPDWFLYAPGSATPSASPSGFPSSAKPILATGFLPLPPAVPTRRPAPLCSPNTFSFSKIAGADVTPGRTSAVVSWYNVGGSNLLQFRLTAIGQNLVVGRQRDVGWVVAKPTMPCGQMTATIGGLSRKTGYVFSVDAVVVRRSGDGSYAATVARSKVVTTQ
jgi:hypothetical protein